LLDVRNGVISRDAALDVYSVVLTADGRAVDWDQMKRARIA
jgi:hypothetical protein